MAQQEPLEICEHSGEKFVDQYFTLKGELAEETVCLDCGKLI